MIKRYSIHDIVKYFIFILIFSLSFILFYKQVYYKYPSDLTAHIYFAQNIVDGNLYIPHPMFHYITYYLHKITNISIEIAAILVNTLLVVLLSIIVYKISFYFLKENFSKYINMFIMVLVIFSGTFYIPDLGLTKYQYVGNGSIAIWHNVTLYMVKPFAFLSFFLFFYAIDRNYEIKLLSMSLILSILSIFAKPSYIVVFLPMVISYFIYKSYKNKFFNKKILIYVTLLTLSSSIILFYQVNGTYGTEEQSKIIIAPFEVWKLYSNNIFISIVVANFFIFLFLITNYKYLTIRSVFSLIMLLGGILLFSIFAEEGVRFEHGNFAWSYLIVMQLAYLSIIIDYINNYKFIVKTKKIVLNFSLIIHFVFGCNYFANLLMGRSYF